MDAKKCQKINNMKMNTKCRGSKACKKIGAVNAANEPQIPINTLYLKSKFK